MAVVDEIKSTKEIIKDKNSIFTLITLLVLTWLIFTNINIEYEIWKIKINILLALIISVGIIIWWIINKLYIPKNKTQLPGIAFLICSDEIEKSDIEKNTFFKLLKNECFNEFNIIVYSQKDLNYYKKRKYSIDEIMKELKLTLFLEVKERKGNIEYDNNYEIEIVSTTVQFSYIPNPYFLLNLSTDFTNSVNKYIKISHKNNLKDSKEEISMLKLSSLYILSIIKILSDNPEDSFQKLDQISSILRVSKIDKKEYNYISKNLIYRYLEAYSNTIYKILMTEKYYSNAEILNKVKVYQDNMYKILKKSRDANEINKQVYKIYYENYLLREAILQYEEKNIEKALNIINKCDFTTKDNTGAYFSKAFLLMINNKIEESLKIYKKLLMRKDLEQSQVEEILKFIEKRIPLNLNTEKLNFCYAVINYYRKDKILGIRIFDELRYSVNNKLNQEIELILSSDNK